MKKRFILVALVLILATSCSLMPDALSQKVWLGKRGGSPASAELSATLERYSIPNSSNYWVRIFLYHNGKCIITGGAYNSRNIMVGRWSTDSGTIYITGKGSDDTPFSFSSSYSIGKDKLHLDTELVGINDFKYDGYPL